MTGLFPEVIETERLRLEPRSPEYVDPLEAYEICAHDPGIDEVTRHVSWEPHRTPKETLEFLRRGEKYREAGEAIGYAIRPREGEAGAGEIAGFCGLNLEWERRSAELGIWLRKRFWGRGYSGERAVALAELAFDRLDLELVRVSHDPGNRNSRRAIERYVERLGGRRDGTFRNYLANLDGTPCDQVCYSVSREEWREATDGGTNVLE